MVYGGYLAHWNHANIIKYTNRPYTSVEEMNEALITNWNSRVQHKDTVYFLGDFCFARGNAIEVRHAVAKIVSRLNGSIHFIKGNHDDAAEKNKDLFASWCDGYKEININGQGIVLCHYFFRTWNKAHYGNWSLAGHSHNTLPDDPCSLSIDIGVDATNYFPISFEEVKTIMSKKLWKPIDHHKGKTQESGGIGLSKEEYARAQRKTLYLQLKEEFESPASQ